MLVSKTKNGLDFWPSNFRSTSWKINKIRNKIKTNRELSNDIPNKLTFIPQFALTSLHLCAKFLLSQTVCWQKIVESEFIPSWKSFHSVSTNFKYEIIIIIKLYFFIIFLMSIRVCEKIKLNNCDSNNWNLY